MKRTSGEARRDRREASWIRRVGFGYVGSKGEYGDRSARVLQEDLGISEAELLTLGR